MRTYVIFFMLLLFVGYSAFAQTYSSFEKWMPKPTAPYSLKNTAYCESYHGGNTWVVYQIDSMQGSTIKGQQQWLMRMDMDGDNLWSKRLVCTNSDYVMSIVSTPDDGALLTGITKNGSYMAGWLCKVDKDGNIQWTRRYNDVTPFSTTIFRQSIYKDGYYYTTGKRSWSGTVDILLNKADTLGNLIWTRFYKENAFSASLDASYITDIPNKSEIVLAANVANYIFLIKTDTSGNTILWNKTYTTTYTTLNTLTVMQIIPNHQNLYLALRHSPSYVLQIDSIGNILWNRYNKNVSYYFTWEKGGKIISHSFQGFSIISANNEINSHELNNTYSFAYDWYHNPIFQKSHGAISVSNAYLTSHPKIWMHKIDTSFTFECPISPISSRDTNTIKDTTSIFSVIKPTYNTTTLSTLRTEPLNLQWTFECGKLAPSSVITHNSPAFNLVLYPNPAQESITIRTDLKNYELRLWDSYGKLLYTAPNIQQSEYTIPILHLPQGTYHAECISNNQHYVQTFVKIH